MTAGQASRRPPLRVVFFLLLLASGLVPLVLVDVLMVTAAPREGYEAGTLAILAGSAALLVALAWFGSGWLAAAVLEPVARLSEALGKLSRGDFDAWVSPDGAVTELSELSEDLNQMTARTRETVARLRQSESDSARLANEAMSLFQEAVKAKLALAKHHPGLLEAYSHAAARQLGERAVDSESDQIVESLFEALDNGNEEQAERRGQPRYAIRDLLVEGSIGAKIVDVSATGLGLETVEPLKVGSQERFEVVEHSRRLQIPACAMWCKLVRTLKTSTGDMVPVYRAGVRFAEVFSAGERERLLEIAQSYRRVA